MVGTSSSQSTSLKDYLKKYTSNADEEKKKKKRKKKDNKPLNSGLIVVDDDPVWQKPVKPEEEEEDSADEEKPLVEEDIEVKYMKRLEMLRSKRALGIISEDGSGWVSVSDDPKRKSSMSEDQSSDLSPPRKRRARNDTPSPKTEQQHDNPADDDLSPPRQRRKHDQSPPESKENESHVSRVRAAHHDTPSPEAAGAVDLSPPRRRQRVKRSISPEPERNSSRYDTKDLDLSPPRHVRGRASRHDSPSPKPNMKASGSGRVARDLSPPSRQRSNKHVSSAEPGRILSHAKAKDGDLSPPRRGRRVSNNDSGASSPKDLSPPRKRKIDGSGSSISTKRSHRSFDENEVDDTAPSVSDLSPPRRRRKDSPVSLHRPKTGLVTGGEIKAEIDKKRMEDLLRFKEMDPSVSGRDAEAVYRNKVTGERMSKEEYLQLKNKEKAKYEKPKEIKVEWGKGLVQKREAEARLQELETEKNKPFARNRDDPDLDTMLKERVRWGDPMAHLVKKKNFEPVLPDLGESETMQKSGFIIPQEIPNHSWIKRRVEAAPNRYGIRPGRHWDGVDRSNGYEKELFKRTNEKRANELEAYQWSVADM